jgi:hypothetical protein
LGSRHGALAALDAAARCARRFVVARIVIAALVGPVARRAARSVPRDRAALVDAARAPGAMRVAAVLVFECSRSSEP